MNHHAADADKCPAKLMEAKHQMNNLHKAINDLADLINTTEGDLHVVNDELKDTLGKIKDIEDEKEKDTTKATVDKKDNGEMLATLRKEMEEMRQIAQPSVSISDLNDLIMPRLTPMGVLCLCYKSQMLQSLQRARAVMARRFR